MNYVNDVPVLVRVTNLFRCCWCWRGSIFTRSHCIPLWFLIHIRSSTNVIAKKKNEIRNCIASEGKPVREKKTNNNMVIRGTHNGATNQVFFFFSYLSFCFFQSCALTYNFKNLLRFQKRNERYELRAGKGGSPFYWRYKESWWIIDLLNTFDVYV